MAHVFDVLRANDLIFQYVGNNWLQGQQPPAFDLLVWNKRQHADARQDAFAVPALVLSQQRVRQGKFEVGEGSDSTPRV
jgi:polyhydroxyalkanoate synthase